MKQELTFKKDEQNFAAPFKIRETFSFGENAEVPEMFANLDLEKGKYFWGYANIATPDSMGDKFTLDALTQISQSLTVPPYNKIFLFHNYQDIAIGKIVYTLMDSLGLIILAKLNEAHSRADETMESIANGSLDGFSMAGNLIRVISDYDEETGQFVNLVLEATAKEVTLTSIPAHPGASVMGAFRKSMQKYNDKFMKSFKDGKEVKSEKYKKNTDLENSMESDDIKKDDVTPGVEDQDNKSQDNAQDQDSKKNDDNANVDKKDHDDQKDADNKADDKDDSDEDKDAIDKSNDADKDAADDSDADDSSDELGKLKTRNEELEKENEELKIKLATYEKAVKMGYEKAMEEKKKIEDKKEDEKAPFRKSVKSPDNKEVKKSNSIPGSSGMIDWLKN